MKTIKVTEATERQLDWLVAKCEGLPVALHNTGAIYLIDTPWADKSRVKWLAEFGPTRHWAQGGPIKERQRIGTNWVVSNYLNIEGCWSAHIPQSNGKLLYAQTELVAAMRCYVASKLGREVEVPEELS